MKCPNCGNKINKEAKICPQCGGILPQTSGNTKKKKKNGEKQTIILLIIFALVLMNSSLILILVYRNKLSQNSTETETTTQYTTETTTQSEEETTAEQGKDDPNDDDQKNDDSTSEIETIESDGIEGDRKTLEEGEIDSDIIIDADSYFKENSKVLSVIKANESEKLINGKQANEEFSQRGFNETDVTSSYTINGEVFTKDLIIEDTSTDIYPTYQTYYTNSSDEIWIIYIMNGCVMAEPLSYNSDSEKQNQVIISENDYIVSYDFYSNSFYHIIPNEPDPKIIKKERIDSSLLNELTCNEIDKYF